MSDKVIPSAARDLQLTGRAFALLLAMVTIATAPQCAPKLQQQGTSNNSDSGRVARLEREARAIANIDGCSSAEQCRAAPVGDRPCGGPRDYIVYCARTTDSAALYHKLAELRQAEIELNKRSGAMSTCEFRMPPETGLSGGSCRAR
jgi:hypothetical protein